MLFVCLLTLFGFAAVSAEITASDLPQCAIECYCEAGEKIKIPITAYKQQCESAPFQLAIRECGTKTCSKDELEFVCPQSSS
jgi:CFEM domain